MYSCSAVRAAGCLRHSIQQQGLAASSHQHLRVTGDQRGIVLLQYLDLLPHSGCIGFLGSLALLQLLAQRFDLFGQHLHLQTLRGTIYASRSESRKMLIGNAQWHAGLLSFCANSHHIAPSCQHALWPQPDCGLLPVRLWQPAQSFPARLLPLAALAAAVVAPGPGKHHHIEARAKAAEHSCWANAIIRVA